MSGYWILKGISVALLLLTALFIYMAPFMLLFTPIICIVIYYSFWNVADMVNDQEKQK